MSLSGRTLLFAGLIILSAILDIWRNAQIAGLWLWFAVFLLLMIAIERLALTRQYTIQREIAPSITLGRPTHYRQLLHNDGNRKLILDSQTDYPVGISGEQSIQHWTVAPGTTQCKLMTLLASELGTHSLGILYIRELGRFRLVWWTRHITDSPSFKVEPAVLEHIPGITGQVRSEGQRKRQIPGSGFELLALREIQPGDPLRLIDWKASAKRRQAMVRLFNREQRLEIAILLDCGRAGKIQCGTLDRFHHYVNIAARLNEFALRHEDQVACIAYAEHIINIAPLRSGLAAARYTRNLLSGLSAGNGDANPLDVALQIKHILKRRGLIIFLTEIEQAAAAAQLIQAVRLLTKKHHVLVATLEDETIAKLTLQTSRQWLDPYLNFAAHEYNKGRELTCSKLRYSGVAVVKASPDKLDRAVLQYYQKLRERTEV